MENNILHEEYYPHDGVTMTNDLSSRMRNIYDFAVAYENILRDGQTATDNKVSISDYATSTEGESDKIWTYTKKWKRISDAPFNKSSGNR